MVSCRVQMKAMKNVEKPIRLETPYVYIITIIISIIKDFQVSLYVEAVCMVSFKTYPILRLASKR